MPNISLSSRCNLHCPYCFAHETMGAGSGDITLENFDAALEFLTRTGPVNIGLIGGEPTLHPHFDEIVRRAVACENVAMLTVYTNGLLIEKHADVLSLPKVTLLVNWNAPSELREGAFERIMCGVDELVFNRGMGRRINLGLNLHGETMEYGYMLDLLKRYGFDKVRISLTVLEFPEGCGQNAIERFRACKPFLLKMFADMDAIGVLPYYDCNRPPWCIWSDEEKRWLRDLAARHVPHGTCLKGSGPMLGLSLDAEQGCWRSVCIHGRSRYCRLLKTFVIVIGKSEHEAARRILM